MIGRVIEDDLFGISARLKSIDDGYFIFRNYKTGKFEVHNRKCRPNTLCLVLPYDELDERTVRRVRYTAAERVKKIVEDMERANALAAAREARSKADMLAAAVRKGEKS